MAIWTSKARYPALMTACMLPVLATGDSPTATQLLPFDAAVCFAYDADPAGPDRPPTRRTASLRLGARAEWNVGEGRDRPYHEVYVAIAVEPGEGDVRNVLGYCSDYTAVNTPDAPPGLTCDLPCATNAFRLDAVDADTLALHVAALDESCRMTRSLGAVDAVFLLRRQPLDVCRELEAWPADEAGIQAAYARGREAAD